MVAFIYILFLLNPFPHIASLVLYWLVFAIKVKFYFKATTCTRLKSRDFKITWRSLSVLLLVIMVHSYVAHLSGLIECLPLYF